MSFSDVFKSSFLSNINSFSTLDVLLALGLSFVLGLFIFMIYKKTYSGVMYSDSFGVSLIAMSMITSLVIIAVTSNVVLSLCMVGALSIVRFRTAIKEPLDIAFLFWAIGVGIVLAAGMIPLAIIGSVILGIILILFVNKKSHTQPYIAVINCTGRESEKAVCDFLKKETNRCVIKGKTVAKGSIELNLEMRLRDDDTDFINTVADMNGVSSAVLVSYNGDYMG